MAQLGPRGYPRISRTAARSNRLCASDMRLKERSSRSSTRRVRCSSASIGTALSRGRSGNDNKRVEKVAIRKQGSQYFAQRENEPSIYELDSSAVDGLQKAAADVKEAAPEPSKKK